LSCLLQITILAHKPDNELLLFAIDGLSHQHQSFMCLCLLQITILAHKPDDELLLLASDQHQSPTCLVVLNADHHPGSQA